MEEFPAPEADGAYHVVEGSSRLEAFERTVPFASCVLSGDLPPPVSKAITLATPVPLPQLAVRTSDDQELALFGVRPGGTGTGTGRPVLINLWSATCAPCVLELTAFAARAEELVEEGVAFLALSVDEDADAAVALMQRIEWPFAWGFATPEALARLDALHGALLDTEERMPLPTSFLIDAAGEVRALWRGAVEPDDFFRHLSLVDATPEEQLARAVPFPGVGFWRSPPARDLSFFQGRFRRRGLEEAAKEYERGSIEVRERTRGQMLYEFARDHVSRGDLAAAAGALRQSIEEDPDAFEPRFLLGQVLHRQREPHEAIGAYLGALELEPGNADAHFNLALVYLETRQLVSAERHRARLEELGSPLAARLAEVIEQVRAQLEAEDASGDEGSG